MAVTTQTQLVSALTGNGGFPALYAQQPAGLDPAGAAAVTAGGAVVLTAGGQTNAVTQGLNGTGMGAVASAAGTYWSALSAAKKLQMGLAGIHITPVSVSISCHSADVASFGATLAAVLNSAGNFGPVGS